MRSINQSTLVHSSETLLRMDPRSADITHAPSLRNRLPTRSLHGSARPTATPASALRWSGDETHAAQDGTGYALRGQRSIRKLKAQALTSGQDEVGSQGSGRTGNRDGRRKRSLRVTRGGEEGVAAAAGQASSRRLGVGCSTGGGGSETLGGEEEDFNLWRGRRGEMGSRPARKGKEEMEVVGSFDDENLLLAV